MNRLMRPRQAGRASTLALLAATLALNACTSPEPRFYVLSPLAPTNSAATSEIAVGVGPVQFPDYLDRPQIVTRRDRNELEISDFERWAEPLQRNSTQVISENLASLLPSKRIVVYPWKRSTGIDYQITIDVARFDRRVDGESVLEARWAILDGEGRNEVLNRRARYAEWPTGSDYPATVAAMERTLLRLTRDIADALRSLRR